MQFPVENRAAYWCCVAVEAHTLLLWRRLLQAVAAWSGGKFSSKLTTTTAAAADGPDLYFLVAAVAACGLGAVICNGLMAEKTTRWIEQVTDAVYGAHE